LRTVIVRQEDQAGPSAATASCWKRRQP